MISRLKKTIQFIYYHPFTSRNKLVALKRYLTWQFATYILRYPVVYPFVENSKLIIHKGMTGATGNIYVGLHDFEEMGFLLHLLRKGDLFADIGANIGSYTVLASAVIGANTFCFEPVPSTFQHLLVNIKINGLEQITNAFNEGLGDKNATLKFSKNLDTINHVLSEDEKELDYIEVPVHTLDSRLGEFIPLLIKLDVEGFEYQILQGGKNTLMNPSLKAIIIELNGSGNRYGISDTTIHQFLNSFGFRPCEYYPFERQIQELKSFKNNGNTIYVRDFDFVKQRIKEQRKIRVHTIEF